MADPFDVIFENAQFHAARLLYSRFPRVPGDKTELFHFCVVCQVVLSACSTYFDTILSQYEEKDPIVIMRDVKFSDIKVLVEFMYKGEINIDHVSIAPFSFYFPRSFSIFINFCNQLPNTKHDLSINICMFSVYIPSFKHSQK